MSGPRRTIERLRPGEARGEGWALGPAALAFADRTFDPGRLPALLSTEPFAALWWSLIDDDLVLFGPYGDTAAWSDLVAACVEVGRQTGRRSLRVAVRNDEIERFEMLQRLGFVLYEARVGVFAGPNGDDSGRFCGDIAVRDELLLTRGVPH